MTPEEFSQKQNPGAASSTSSGVRPRAVASRPPARGPGGAGQSRSGSSGAGGGPAPPRRAPAAPPRGLRRRRPPPPRLRECEPGRRAREAAAAEARGARRRRGSERSCRPGPRPPQPALTRGHSGRRPESRASTCAAADGPEHARRRSDARAGPAGGGGARGNGVQPAGPGPWGPRYPGRGLRRRPKSLECGRPSGCGSSLTQVKLPMTWVSPPHDFPVFRRAQDADTCVLVLTLFCGQIDHSSSCGGDIDRAAQIHRVIVVEDYFRPPSSHAPPCLGAQAKACLGRLPQQNCGIGSADAFPWHMAPPPASSSASGSPFSMAT
ncbi:hypothetical protein LEMLEM_LOCUS20581 [Lemmus lemmus]